MSTTFTPQTIGQTEKALNAILDRLLAGSGLSEPQWVALTVSATATSSTRDALIGRLAGALKVSPDEAQTRIAELATAGLVEDDGSIELTPEGRELHARIRTATAATTQRLWGDLPAEDLATAERVLTIVLERANAELAAA